MRRRLEDIIFALNFKYIIENGLKQRLSSVHQLII